MSIKIEKPRDVHSYFDFIRAESDFFRYSRFEALLHGARTLETQVALATINQQSQDAIFLNERSLQDISKYIFFWIYKDCKFGDKYVLTQNKDISTSIPILELAHNYSLIHDLVVAVEKNWASFSVYDQSKTVEFKYLDIKKSFQFVTKLQERLKRQKEQSVLLKSIIEENRDLQTAFIAFQENVSIKTNNQLRIRMNRSILNGFEYFARISLRDEYILDESWSIGDYTVTQFREIWTQLTKLSLIHELALNICIEKYRDKTIALYNNSIIRFHRKLLVKYLAKHTGFDMSLIDKILFDLTYNVEIPFIDIIQQPLLHIGKNEIFFSPRLILGSNVDRNLQVLFSKLPYRQKEYSLMKNLKEEKMIADCSDALNSCGYLFKANKKLKQDGQQISDIDMLVWDSNYICFLVVEMKWFYGADSTQEVSNHDDWFNEGIEKVKRIIMYLRENKRFIEDLIRKSISPDSRIAGIILSKIGTPTSFVQDPSFPVIEEVDFFEIVKNNPGNVNQLNKEIQDFYDSSKHVSEVKESTVTKKIGEYRFILPAIEY